ncbi:MULTISPECIES: hypothetical protein [Nitratidesulfovibrio]|jgi:hypothetical protein|uniref:Uncharacterized protein n=1 Tax=Nitratidesulfovibrio liaohensis TaxID=2604158 RepID=A0ABY9QYR7_9BACT|nr:MULTISPECIES: hypothetical protein [Nitratidesulfovibrio]WMW64644.1 hypothetical protein KPS_002697 [Nitratidesulfovibrio liaohensis]
MHPKEEFYVPMVSQDDVSALAERIREALHTSPEDLAQVEAIQISLVPVIATRMDITIIPKR